MEKKTSIKKRPCECIPWPCGCIPYSSRSNDYCDEHQLKLGSLEQRIIATTKYLNKLINEFSIEVNGGHL